jgi:hypothetical protein
MLLVINDLQLILNATLPIHDPYTAHWLDAASM